MRSFNEVILIGGIGQDPELRFDAAGKPRCTFNLATNGYGDKVDWHRIVVFGPNAEACAKFLQKGSQVMVKGHISYYKQNEITRTSIVAEFVNFLSNIRREQPALPAQGEIPFPTE